MDTAGAAASGGFLTKKRALFDRSELPLFRSTVLLAQKYLKTHESEFFRFEKKKFFFLLLFFVAGAGFLVFQRTVFWFLGSRSVKVFCVEASRVWD